MAVAECESCGKKVVLRGNNCALCGHQVVEGASLLSIPVDLINNEIKYSQERREKQQKEKEAVEESAKSEPVDMEQAIINAEERIAKKKAGNGTGWASVIFAILGIFTLGVVFVPIALLLSVAGFIQAMGARNGNGELINVLGFFLAAVGFITSPVLLIAIGMASQG